MKKYRVLCLTDHDKHSKENSIYAIASAMAIHPQCKEIVVASRSADINSSFFYHNNFEKICGLTVGSDFNYDDAKKDLHEKTHEVKPSDFDIIFLRIPRPITDDFLNALELKFNSKCFVNKPSGIITCSSKAVLLNFQDVCPPIKLCHSINEIMAFSETQDIVLKPLREYGGKGIVRIKNKVVNDGNQNVDIQEYLTGIESTITQDGLLAMKYLENVSQGDKRLIVVGGKVLASSLRLPSEDSWLCNVALGGTSVSAEADKDELEIIERINPFLNKEGILIYGVDTLVDDSGKRTLSEINALSIGGFPQAQKQTGQPIIKMTIDKIFNYADVHYQ
ncbi:MAG: hypothetical protein HKO66_16070 [Saprospiraceae bacterium]|nr:hypothetical protein [Bacteroidia bacterium]NNE16567.1 hypothetical protein [Saprospiraceae bacterium]NNL93760.1 hypothetical protein [Saprospiraceae bacterium]